MFEMFFSGHGVHPDVPNKSHNNTSYGKTFFSKSFFCCNGILSRKALSVHITSTIFSHSTQTQLLQAKPKAKVK